MPAGVGDPAALTPKAKEGDPVFLMSKEEADPVLMEEGDPRSAAPPPGGGDPTPLLPPGDKDALLGTSFMYRLAHWRDAGRAALLRQRGVTWRRLSYGN